MALTSVDTLMGNKEAERKENGKLDGREREKSKDKSEGRRGLREGGRRQRMRPVRA